jgi:hypothetical protein
MPSITKENDKWIVNCEEIFDTYEEAQKRANELTFEKLKKLQDKKL